MEDDRTKERRLHYVADPMCSWCWGFASVLAAIEADLRPDCTLRLVMGGLAPDDDAPMNEAMRRYVQGAWRSVEQRTGARFDHSFWERHTPRRSTWPACRAVLAAGERGREMFDALQRAFYLQARDPSDRATLVEVAGELGLEREAFESALDAPETHARLREDFALRDRLGIQGYPSLALEGGGGPRVLTQGWTDEATLRPILVAEGVLRTTAGST